MNLPSWCLINFDFSSVGVETESINKRHARASHSLQTLIIPGSEIIVSTLYSSLCTPRDKVHTTRSMLFKTEPDRSHFSISYTGLTFPLSS